jgi:hypothetical protein
MRQSSFDWLRATLLVMSLCITPSIVLAEDRDARIESLIQQLASSNMAPEVRVPDVKLPANYDKAAQVKVLDAFNALVEVGEAAFPLLIDHACDKAYSASLASSSTQFNETVGGMCRKIVYAQLAAYESHLRRGLGRWRPRPSFAIDCKGLQAWGLENRKKELWELQVEELDNAIKQLRDVDRDELVRNYHAREKDVDKAISSNIERLQDLRKELSESETALIPKITWGDDRTWYKMLGLPPRRR